MSEIVVIVANNDKTDRDRVLRSTGLDSKILVTSAPCMKLTGTAPVTYKWANVTETLSASGLQFEYYAYNILSEDLRQADLISLEIEMLLVGGSASWHISGTDSNDFPYSGSAAFTISESNWAVLDLQYQLLPGSRRFLGYEGSAGPDSDAEVTYAVHCPNQDPETVTGSSGYFFMPGGEMPITPGGLLAGSKTIDEGDGNSTTYNWSLSPSPLP